MNTTASDLTEFTSYMIAAGYSQQTTAGTVKKLKKFTQWINEQNIEPINLNYNDITAYIQHNKQRAITTGTLNQILLAVKHYLNYLVKADIIPYNPALALQLKNAKRKTIHQLLNPEELETIYKSYKTELPLKPNSPPQALNQLARKRNKIVLSLIVYQGIAADDIKNIELKHLELREGKIIVPGTRRSNERTLKLESHQIFDLYDYINETRKAILQATGKENKQLFISVGSGGNVQNLLHKLITELRASHSCLKNLEQLRASVITNWLKLYNKRKVQYMAGHRYVSSTEAYEAGNIEQLQEDVERYYPIL